MKDTITNDKNISNFLKEVRWTDVGLCLFAIAFARVGVGGVFFTLGIAYLATLFMSKEIRIWGTIFTILGYLSMQNLSINMLKYIFIAVLLFAIRWCMTLFKKECTVKNQAVILAISIWVIGTLALGVKGFNWLEFLNGFFEGIIGAACVLIIHYGVGVLREGRRTPLTTKEAISMVFIFACILGGMVDLYIKVPLFKEIYFRDILTFIVLIAVTYLGGVQIGITMSVVVSAVLILIGYMPVQFGIIYAVSILMGGMFLTMGRNSLIVAIGLGQLVGFAVFNDRTMDFQILGAYLIAAIVSAMLPKKYFGMDSWFGYKEEEMEQIHLLRIQSLITERLNNFAKAFEHLGDTFVTVAPKQMELTLSAMKNIIEDTGEKLCCNCSMNQFCWERDLTNTYSLAYTMLKTADKKGYLTVGDIPNKFKNHCCNSEQFAYMLNFKLDLHKQNLMWQNRLAESRELVGEQLRAIATSIEQLSTEVQEELYFNKEEEQILTETLKAEGIRVKDVMIVENAGKKQEILIYTQYCNKSTHYVNELMAQIEKVLDIRTELERHECDEEGCKFKFKISRTYQVTAGAAFCAKGKISGDVYSFMEIDDNQYLLALADGMGSGSLAQEESTATIELLEDFMEAGFKNDLAVKLINSVLVLKSTEENFSTMDITLIDMNTGVAEFLKAGAATTFILRDGEIMTIRAISFPVGILKDVDVEIYKKQLQDGDIIIMVTDGMLASQDDVLGKEETFKHFIKEVDSDSPSYMAEYLMKKSRDLLGNDDGDDMTVVVAKVWEKF